MWTLLPWLPLPTKPIFNWLFIWSLFYEPHAVEGAAASKKEVLRLLSAEFGGSGVNIRENIITTSGTNILTRVCPGTPVTDSSSVIQEHAQLLYSAQPPSERCRIAPLRVVSKFYVIPDLYRAMATPPQWKKRDQGPPCHGIWQGLTPSIAHG